MKSRIFYENVCSKYCHSLIIVYCNYYDCAGKTSYLHVDFEQKTLVIVLGIKLVKYVDNILKLGGWLVGVLLLLLL